MITEDEARSLNPDQTLEFVSEWMKKQWAPATLVAYHPGLDRPLELKTKEGIVYGRLDWMKSTRS